MKAVANRSSRDGRYAIWKGKVVIFGAGTGNPNFTTDTGGDIARASRSSRYPHQSRRRLTGIYDRDPVRNADAIKYEKISYTDGIDEETLK